MTTPPDGYPITACTGADRLGGYPLLDRIGGGSMGVVYRSMDPATARPLALKTLKHPPCDRRLAAAALSGTVDAGFRTRLAREAAALARLDHPGIVGMVAHGDAGGRPYLALEYVDGTSLERRIDRGTVFSAAAAIDILVQLLAALQHAHDRGVWHRDVKPSNLLVTQDDRVKLTDFGIARLVAPWPGAPPGADDATDPAADPRDILGTPGYIAPETYVSSEYDGRVDVFAAGAVLYLLLTGRPAFSGNADAIMYQVCTAAPPAPSAAAASPPLAALDAVVLKALARRATDRFASPTEFRTALIQAGDEIAEAHALRQPLPGRDP